MTAKASYLIGVTVSSGPVTNSISLKRFSGTGKLYQEALDNLWGQFAAEHGAVEGRRLALTNVRYDADTRNFALYSDVVLAVRADRCRIHRLVNDAPGKAQKTPARDALSRARLSMARSSVTMRSSPRARVF